MTDHASTAAPANANAPATTPKPQSESAPTKHKVRVVSAASLFDGHDAAINVMRRIMQDAGAEIVHLAHNRSVDEIVSAAIQEDAQAIAISSYQGGHVEFFKYAVDLLKERNAGHIRVYGGGGGTIVPREIDELHAYGVARLFSPDDGRRLGLQGMIDLIIRESDYSTLEIAGAPDVTTLSPTPADWAAIARAITAAEAEGATPTVSPTGRDGKRIPVLGITGTGGSGKSSVTDELLHRFLRDFPDKTVAVVSVDPSRKRTGGALLGDRIRMNSLTNPRTYMRSLATRDSESELSRATHAAVHILKQVGYDLIIVETSGIGQSNIGITKLADVSLYVMTAEYGAPSQLEKIDMLDFADVIALNKFERQGAKDALQFVRKQVQRNRKAFTQKLEEMPVYPTIAARFADPGVNALYVALIEKLAGVVEKDAAGNGAAASWLGSSTFGQHNPLDYGDVAHIIPNDRTRYLAEIADTVRAYKRKADDEAEAARRVYKLEGAIAELKTTEAKDALRELEALRVKARERVSERTWRLLDEWAKLREAYAKPNFEYEVRGKAIHTPLTSQSLSHLDIPKVVLPTYADWGDILRWRLLENVPGQFPFTAGVFPLKRTAEDPIRMFAGEGGPEKTNRRFHYLAGGQPFARLSTAFDSVTLYGEDPDRRPDIWGKIGNSGVAISSLDDAKRLYSGFDLCDPTTSVSMTINGPAPMILAFFLNAAIDQQVERWLRENDQLDAAREYAVNEYKKAGVPAPAYRLYDHKAMPEGNDGYGLAFLGISGAELAEAGIIPADVYEKLSAYALTQVRGTVQADILKEDQAQNTCIFSTEFAMRMMGDIQAFFVENNVRNFYSVSISGYHIAEAGANPVTQLALTLANGFTYVEYYRARGMDVDAFAPNLSFFFSNGVDPEYAVIGRVARRIWAVAMRELYGANDRSQKLKYHIQTSGRSLHAQEIEFNDIRTTLQALLAIYDNCNSLHTNAYDEAITTPTEDSVRRAVAIQMIINKEFGPAKNENPNQGSFFMEWLTDAVEEAVLDLFMELANRGGVLGAMETGYQRARIQEESLYYEHLKHAGTLPIIGVNTYIDPAKLADDYRAPEPELRRSTEEEKQAQLDACTAYQKRHEARAKAALARLQEAATTGGNIFTELMACAREATLGQMSHALYEVGGQYRRNM